MKLGLVIKEYQDFHTDLNRSRDFMGSLARISIKTSSGMQAFDIDFFVVVVIFLLFLLNLFAVVVVVL